MTGGEEPAHLTVGETRMQLLRAGTPLLIGRESPSQLVLDHPLISRRHAEVYYDQGWRLRDLGSTNGTWCEGRRVQSVPIQSDTVIRLGDPRTGVLVSLEHPAGTGLCEPAEPSHPRLVGRDPHAEIHVDDPVASWRHAELVPADERSWTIVDLGSKNQTIVNGAPVSSRALEVGDTVLIGNTKLRWSGRDLQPAADEAGFVVDGASWDVKGRRIVNAVSFSMHGPSLVAVIGPSGAGKSSLLRLITGQTEPSEGAVSMDGATLASQRSAHRGQIGFVPQYTVGHESLTARQVLVNAARLRLPADTRRTELKSLVESSLDRLGLSAHADTRMSRLSGGQQRRVGIAMEMLTDPALLILDEPTAGLDPSLVLQIMQTLRRLADAGTQVILVTHDLDHLNLADEVVVLRAGGTVAYSGPPSGVFGHFGSSTWADTFDRLSLPAPNPPEVPLRSGVATAVQPTELPAPPTSMSTVRRHLAVVARRQLRLIATDPVYLGLLILMPAALAVLTLAVPGSDGLRPSSDPTSAEATRILVILVVGAAFLGLSATIRDLVSERPIFLHERDAGLEPGAYLAAKTLVFTVVAAAQAFLLTGLVLTTRNGPEGAVMLGSPTLELAVAVSLVALTSVTLGLAVSARVRTSEQAMPPLVLIVMTQLVLCGGMFPVDDRGILPVLSGLMPTRWGYAMAASTTDLNHVSAAVDADPIWAHTADNWLGGALVLTAMWLAFGLLALLGLRRRPPS